MFLAHAPGRSPMPVTDEAVADLAGWLDLIDPSGEEVERATRITGLRIPTREQLDEIESSSRLMMEGDVFYLSTPLVRRHEEDGTSDVTPIGFVLSRDRLITVRFTDWKVFDNVTARVTGQSLGCDADAVMVMLLEGMVDRLADGLERLGADLDRLSGQIFRTDRERTAQVDRLLRGMLREIGSAMDLLSDMRDSLLGVGRIALYLKANSRRSLHELLAEKVDTVRRDVDSLNDYVPQMYNKAQFLLDATLGFINIEQNNGIRVLTVVSFIGVMPTLVASIYGMNFKNIPELNWTYGYYYALGLMLLTIAGPLFVFWKIGWLGGLKMK